MAGFSSIIFVLVPGSFHKASLFDILVKELSTRSYACITIDLPSVNSSQPFEASATSDSNTIRNRLTSLVEEGKDFVLVLHSYAGIPGAGAALGFFKAQRFEEGKSGGIIGIVGIAAVLANEDETCLQNMGGVYPAWSAYNVRCVVIVRLERNAHTQGKGSHRYDQHHYRPCRHILQRSIS